MKLRITKPHASWAARLRWRGSAIALGFVLDCLFADPSKHHPVALYGQSVSTFERRIYADSKSRGVAFTAIAVATPVALTAAASAGAPLLMLVATTWASLGGTTLRRTGERMADRLETEDIDAARELVPWLCSRNPDALDADGIARATVESLAENTSDAVTGTLFWGAVAGAPGVVAHRAINTLDAMVGYRNDRYRQFGWASARLDDIAGYLPARLTAVATAVAGPNRREAMAAWRRDSSNHPSPNAGVVEASAAGALGLQLGGKTVYPSGVEMRPVLGRGRAPEVEDVRRAVQLSKRVQNIVALSCAGAVVVAGLVQQMNSRAKG